MRLRITVLACALAALASRGPAGMAGAAPQHNRGLTIHAVPHSIIAGEAVLIFGQSARARTTLTRSISLYHRINPNRVFSLIGTTRPTPAAVRVHPRRGHRRVQPQLVSSAVRGFTHSRTVHERVAALVSLASSSASGLTRHPFTFSGTSPPTTPVAMCCSRPRMRLAPSGDAQARHDRRQLDFQIPSPGACPARTTSACCSPVTRVTRRARRTRDGRDPADRVTRISRSTRRIRSSSNGSPYTISGTLYKPGTTTPEPATSVSLFKALPGTSSFSEVTTAMTDGAGNYTFANVTSYQRAVSGAGHVPARPGASAVLFEGVQDVVNMTPSSKTSTVGGHVTFSGRSPLTRPGT